MKTRFLLPALILCSTLSPLRAAEPATAALAVDLATYKTADELWKYLETLQQAPTEKPATREEAIALARTRFTQQTTAGTAFDKTYPTDQRRFAARMIALRAEMQLRRITGQPTDTAAERGRLDEIINAAEAPAPLKAEAAFTRAMTYTSDFKTSPESYIAFNQAAADFLAKYAAHPLAPQMQTLQLRVLAEDPTPQGAELLQKIAAGTDAKAAEIAKGLLAKREILGELKSKPVALEFTAVDGRGVDLALMRGKVVLVDFWASWCGPCIAEMPNVVATYAKLKAKGFEVVGISLDEDKAKMEASAKEHAMTWPSYFDGLGWKNKISTKYGIDSIPATWLIDKKGMLRQTSLRGPALEEEVVKLLKE